MFCVLASNLTYRCTLNLEPLSFVVVVVVVLPLRSSFFFPLSSFFYLLSSSFIIHCIISYYIPPSSLFQLSIHLFIHPPSIHNNETLLNTHLDPTVGPSSLPHLGINHSSNPFKYLPCKGFFRYLLWYLWLLFK